MITDLLKELNQYYSNIITALATVIYMIFTGWLIWETRKTRKLQEKPHIEIFVKRANSW
jgi:nicotinamide riboside transporter PnuC